LLGRRSGDGAWCAVLACLTSRMSVTAARPQALIAAISNLLPTRFMTRVRL
jgi:hypothetical protein